MTPGSHICLPPAPHGGPHVPLLHPMFMNEVERSECRLSIVLVSVIVPFQTTESTTEEPTALCKCVLGEGRLWYWVPAFCLFFCLSFFSLFNCFVTLHRLVFFKSSGLSAPFPYCLPCLTLCQSCFYLNSHLFNESLASLGFLRHSLFVSGLLPIDKRVGVCVQI